MARPARVPKRPTRPRRNSTDPVAGLAGSIAHDFSNLLMIMRNASAFLRDDLPPEDPRQAHVRDLIEAADRATHLTQQLQAIGRSQLLKPEIIRPADVLRGIGDTLRRMVPEDVDFRISIRAPTAAVSFDRSQLPVVIMNLVSYAAEHVSSHGRMVLAVSEETFDAKSGGEHGVTAGRYVNIVVAKTGVGMSESELKRVFQPRLTGKNLPRGTDLRLASAHAVVTQLGGFMDVTSELGRGTTFTVYLPVVRHDAAVEPDTLPHMRVHRNLMGNEIVLVVEDDVAVRLVMREALERYGYTVLIATDGSDALSVVQNFNAMPDLLITDLVMPLVTGRELIEALRLEGRLPKVLLMSGYTDDNVLRRATPSESYPFLKKPFTHEELAAKVRTVLDA